MKRSDFLKQAKSKLSNEIEVLDMGQVSTEFIEALELKIEQFKETLGAGVEFNNLSELTEKLNQVQSLNQPMLELKEAIQSIDITLPDSVKIDGLDSLLAHIKSIKEQKSKVDINWLNKDELSNLLSKLDRLIKAVEKASVKSQDAKDFLPYRRVIAVGNRFLFDDSIGVGGGGGAPSPTESAIEYLDFSDADANGNYQSLVLRFPNGPNINYTLTWDANSNLQHMEQI